jgi:hypothetical protein
MPSAKKQKVNLKVAAPTVVAENQRIPITEVDCSIESGWRDVDLARVAELKDMFLKGLFGVNLLRRPMVLKRHGALARSTSGNVLLLDGKHTFVALTELKRMYDTEPTQPEENGDGVPATAGQPSAAAGVVDEVVWSNLLVAALTEGVPVDFVEFEDPDDPDLPIAYCVQSHEEDVNKYKKTSMKDLVGLAMRYKARAPGGTWATVQATMLGFYGAGRRTWIYRMIVAAETLPDVILNKLEKVGVPNSYIFENKFFSGQGVDKPKRLSDEGRLAVLTIYQEEVEKGGTFSKATFVDELCAPLRRAEQWVKEKRGIYGALAQSPAFQRVADFLMTGRARMQILTCMKSGLRLEGTSAENMGIEQCHILIKDLDAARKAALLAQDGASDPATAGDSAADRDESGNDSLGDAQALAVYEAEDTALATAKVKAETVVNKFNYFDTVEQVSC